MNPTKNVLLTVASVVILCAVSSGYAQTLQEMEVKDLGLVPVVVRNPEVGILIVESVIPELSFESNMGIIKVTHDNPGEWVLHLFPGTNLITFKAEGYKSVTDVRLVVPKKRARKVEVKPLITLGTLMVESDPPGAKIFLDGEDTGEQTPYRFENQTAGTHLLVLKMISYRADTTMVDLKAGETKTLSRPLQAMGYLTLDSTPSGVEVVLESGIEEAITVKTPVEKLALNAGAYSLSVRKGDSAMPQDVVTIRKGEIERKHLDLQEIFKSIIIRSQMNKWERWKYLSLTTMLLSGATSGACWVLAEQNYTDYQAASNTEDADKFRKNVERFDRLTIGAAVAAGIQLIPYFYTSSKQSYYKKQLQRYSDASEKGGELLAQRSSLGIVPTLRFDGGVACVGLDIRF